MTKKEKLFQFAFNVKQNLKIDHDSFEKNLEKICSEFNLIGLIFLKTKQIPNQFYENFLFNLPKLSKKNNFKLKQKKKKRILLFMSEECQIITINYIPFFCTTTEESKTKHERERE